MRGKEPLQIIVAVGDGGVSGDSKYEANKTVHEALEFYLEFARDTPINQATVIEVGEY